MRQIILLGLVTVLLCNSSRAQTTPDGTRAPFDFSMTTLERSYRRAKISRNVGLALAVPGVTFTVLGGVFFGHLISGVGGDSLADIIGGSTCVTAGVAMAIPGIIIWVVGQDKMDVASWRKAQLTQLEVQ